MKKTFYFLVILLLIFSCYQREDSITITDFSKTIKNTLVPHEKGSYSEAELIISGYTNDSIKVTFFGIERKYFGEFEDKIEGDYYGVKNVNFSFIPYKATEGKIEIKYGIY